MHIFVDWGSTNFRAFLMDQEKIVDSRQAGGHGVLQVQYASEDRAGQYAAFLKGQLSPWLDQHPGAVIMMCGAIGSREGWINTGYIDAPAGFQRLGRGLRLLTESERGVLAAHKIYILPGLAIAGADGRHDVMRSEEIKSLGALKHLGRSGGLLCIPGTHCKWVRIEDGQITDFHSALTGELYNVLSGAGALAALFDGMPENDLQETDSFVQGLDLARKGNDLLSDLWQVRARFLRDPNPPAHLKNFFSGILIGHELLQTQRLYPGRTEMILLSDRGERRDLYRHALIHFGFSIAAEVESRIAVCTGMSGLMRYCPD